MGTTMLKFTEEVTMVTVPCASCGIIFGLPYDFKEEKYNNKTTFYCPNGHTLSYGGTRENTEVLQNKLREANNRIANISSEKIQLESQLNKSKNDLKRLKNGVCPCCNRSFKGLHEHIKRQHPDYKI